MATATATTTTPHPQPSRDGIRRELHGLPISSTPVESVIKQLNRRVKGTEKFWIEGGAEAMLQVCAAILSEDGRADRYAKRPRPRGRAAGSHRLGRQRK